MKINFQLANPTRATSGVNLTCTLPGQQRLRYSTGVTLHPDQWDKTRSRPRRRAYINSEADAANLDTLAHNLNAHVATLQLTGQTLDPDAAKRYLDTLTGRLKAFTALDWIAEYIDRSTDAKSTKQKQRGTLKVFRQFSPSLTWQEVTLEWYRLFIQHCYEERDVSPNTVGDTYIKNFTTWMGKALDEGQHENLIFKHRAFRKPSATIDRISLTASQVATLEAADLPPRLDRVRDLFLLGRYSGQRYGDYAKLNPRNLTQCTDSNGKPRPCWKITQGKTGTPVTVMVHSKAQRLIDKYHGHLPTDISNQKLNAYIKEACEVAGVTELRERTTYKGNAPLTETVPTWQLVSTHTARRTFATLANEAPGADIYMIRDALGHKSVTVTERYIKTSQTKSVLALHGLLDPQ